MTYVAQSSLAPSIITPTLTNGWSTSPPITAPYYWQDIFGIVHFGGGAIQGTASSGSIAFTLPVAISPVSGNIATMTTTSVLGAIATVQVNASGQVKFFTSNGIYLDGLNFLAGH